MRRLDGVVHVSMRLDRFFFRASAATDCYPYLRSLSLHGALPIIRRRPHRRLVGALRTARHGRAPAPAAEPAALARHRRAGSRRAVPHPARRHRSEEHTSELQSLMRISYAVFCLKTNMKNATHTQPREYPAPAYTTASTDT